MISGVEDKINKAILQQQSEKSYTDKLLRLDDINELRKIISKKELTRDDIKDIQYLLTSSEVKLAKINGHERYVMLKYYIWLSEVCKITESLYDHEANMNARIQKGDIELSDNAKIMLQSTKQVALENIKLMTTFYCLVFRTSLSVEGALIGDLTADKYEVAYHQPTGQTNVPAPK